MFTISRTWLKSKRSKSEHRNVQKGSQSLRRNVAKFLSREHVLLNCVHCLRKVSVVNVFSDIFSSPETIEFPNHYIKWPTRGTNCYAIRYAKVRLAKSPADFAIRVINYVTSHLQIFDSENIAKTPMTNRVRLAILRRIDLLWSYCLIFFKHPSSSELLFIWFVVIRLKINCERSCDFVASRFFTVVMWRVWSYCL